MKEHQQSDRLKQLMDRLWIERHLLEFLLFKLVTAKLILAADSRRFVAPALAEVDHVVQKIRAAEISRSVAVADVADEWGVPADEISLRYLSEHAPEPARTMLAEHREGFLKLSEEIERAAAENRRLATSGLENIRSTISSLTGEQAAATYTPTGHRTSAPSEPYRLDRSL